MLRPMERILVLESIHVDFALRHLMFAKVSQMLSRRLGLSQKVDVFDSLLKNFSLSAFPLLQAIFERASGNTTAWVLSWLFEWAAVDVVVPLTRLRSLSHGRSYSFELLSFSADGAFCLWEEKVLLQFGNTVRVNLFQWRSLICVIFFRFIDGQVFWPHFEHEGFGLWRVIFWFSSFFSINFELD